MNKYSQVAIKAGSYVKDGMTPKDAWEKASCEIFKPGSSSQKKGCPKNAFLGLYGGKGKNAEYAIKALDFLKKNPNINIKPRELWLIVTEGISKTYNQQMDVVIALFEAGLV
ncbi:MAG TPA: hypothetical protein PK761_01535 [Clostridia bacterium]|nr:hypothetical protein [Clostridia bacterium]HOR89131.1 hypothetical protein [Clostridia bacterium]HPL07571.1 hypothetical protein [Clostridia bacterium]